jgi:hypothetical protein
MAKPPAKIDSKMGSFRVVMPIFEDQLEPKGRLIPDRGCQACWYYFMLAQQCMLAVGTGPESQIIVVDDGLETPLWMENRFHQIAQTTAMLYGLESPDDFLKYAPLIEQEANRIYGIMDQPFVMPVQIWKPFMVGKDKSRLGIILP